MKKNLHKIEVFAFIIILSLFSLKPYAQTVCEWRLVNPTYSAVDPDLPGGPATGSVTFTMQLRTVSGNIPNVNSISTGWSYDSTAIMIPTVPGCGTTSNPANVTLSTEFIAAGFAFTTVNQCGKFTQTAGGHNFTKRAVGTLDGTGITLTTTFVDVYTVTLWTLGSTPPEGGYVIINSGELGTPGEFPTYTVADADGNGYPVNSLTYTTPLAMASALPVLFTKFEAGCANSGALVSWSTGSESNSNYFELQRSTTGNNWTSVATIKAAGNSATGRTYQQADPNSGTAYYRIKQVDMDGHSIYTSTVRTNCVRKSLDMAIYPVPATDILNVIITSDKSLKTKLFVIDGIGKVVRKIDATLFNGSNTFLFNLKGLASGVYIIRSNAPGVEVDKTFNIVR